MSLSYHRNLRSTGWYPASGSSSTTAAGSSRAAAGLSYRSGLTTPSSSSRIDYGVSSSSAIRVGASSSSSLSSSRADFRRSRVPSATTPSSGLSTAANSFSRSSSTRGVTEGSSSISSSSSNTDRTRPSRYPSASFSSPSAKDTNEDTDGVERARRRRERASRLTASSYAPPSSCTTATTTVETTKEDTREPIASTPESQAAPENGRRSSRGRLTEDIGPDRDSDFRSRRRSDRTLAAAVDDSDSKLDVPARLTSRSEREKRRLDKQREVTDLEQDARAGILRRHPSVPDTPSSAVSNVEEGQRSGPVSQNPEVSDRVTAGLQKVIAPQVSKATSGLGSDKSVEDVQGCASVASLASPSDDQGRLSKSKVEPLKKGAGAGATTISTSATTTTTTTSTTRANARGPGAQKEIVRLESLCEARTKELTHVKMQLRATTQAFDAMTVLVNYCCTELDAFQCPVLAQKLETVHRQLSDCLAQIAELSGRKESLEQALDQLGHEKEEACRQAQELEAKLVADHQVHEQTQRDLDETHNAALTAQRDELSLKHDEALQKFNQYHDKQMEMMRHGTERQISDLKNENKLEINGIRISHLEEIQELRNKHDSQMEELHKQHRCKLEDITHRFEGIKLSLSEKLDSLRGECDDLRHRARQSEEALQRDADVKVQMALAPFLSLPKEIESLKTVVDMRNEEIQKLRTKTMDMEKQLEEIAIVKEKNISLQQKVENLQAIINIKSDHEKQLHEKCQILMRKYDRESRANKRLSMDYEQVMWRMSQSAEFGSSESLTKRQVSRSPSHSEGNSPDRRRTQSPGAHNSDVVLRVKKRNSNSASEADRKLRSRSATFVMEKPESLDSHVSSPPPQTKSKSRKGTPQKEMVQSEIEAEKSDSDDSKQRMCQSADAKLLENTARDSVDMMARQGGRLLMENGSRNQQNQLELSGELADSYSRSISGVSDSGVYDSLTTSEMLDTSQVSMGSDWMVPTGGSVSFNIVESSNESASNSSGNNVTMLEVDSAIDGQHMQNSALNGEGDLHIQNSSDSNCYHYQVLLPGDGEASYDSVFHDNDQESVSIDSGLLSLENMDVVSNSDSRLKSESEDFTLAGYSCSGENLVRREIFAEHQGEGHGLGSSSES